MITETLSQVKIDGHVKEAMIYYLSLGQEYENPPNVELSLISRQPPSEEGKEEVGLRDIAITTAYQCYAPGVTRMRVREDNRSQKVADSTLEAGHHTTRLHTYYTFLIEGASRSSVHDERHADPFYNSEQQSQRYVEAKEGNYVIPGGLTTEQREIYAGSAAFANRAYFELLDLLVPEAVDRIKKMYPEAGWEVGSTAQRLEQKAKKIGQEVARYVLPIAQKTTFYHTLSALQLIRHFRSLEVSHVSDEGRYTVARMIEEVTKVDPSFLLDLRKPMPNEGIERFFNELDKNFQKGEFDTGLEGRSSKLVGYSSNIRTVLGDTLRNMTGVPASVVSDSEALNYLTNPSLNRILADVFDGGMLDPYTSSLRQIHLTFMTKLSHTADSQRQRHRRTPGATPLIEAIYGGKPDYITPLIVGEAPLISEKYQAIIHTIYQNIERAVDSGIPIKKALLLLPNAQAVRVIESGDLFDWVHRWKQRLCYLAQEEIFFISVEQVQQLKEILPEAEKMLLAPCGIRELARIRPRCPEGDRWCGKPVWNFDIEEYMKGRLV